jgi:alpha-N-acetylglucosaminidase
MVGYEQTLIDVLRGFNFSDDSLSGFLSGPAFQAWNRFGNIQECWNDTLDLEFPKQQMELQKKL